MRIRFTQIGGSNQDGSSYRWEAEIDCADEDEAYVKGRQFVRFAVAMGKAANDEYVAQSQEQSEES